MKLSVGNRTRDLVTNPLRQIQMPLRIYPRHFRSYLEDTYNLVMVDQGHPKKSPQSGAEGGH